MTWDQLLDALGASRYAAHSLCLSTDPVMQFLYILANSSTAASYFVIGLALLLVRRLPEAYRPGLRYLFGGFIFLCGLSHTTYLFTLFAGVYRLDVVVQFGMAIVSVITAFVVVNDFILALPPKGS